MARKVLDSPYQRMLQQRKFGAWAMAVLVAAGLNLFLFALVPYLLSSEPEVKTYKKFVSNVKLVRLQEPEPEEPEPLEPLEEKQEEKEPKPRQEPSRQKPEPTEMSLPFDINPRLPSGPQTVALPAMQNMQVSVPRDRFRAVDLDQPLRAVSRMPPQYPMRAKRRNIEGWVQVQLVVDQQGRVAEVEILDQEPPGVFEQAVRQSVAKWRFEPGTVAGVPVQTVAETRIRFKLD